MWKVAEFGELIGVSSSTLRRWETEGRLTRLMDARQSKALHRIALSASPKPQVR